MPKQRIILIAGIVLALISLVMVNAYISQQREAVKLQAKNALAKIQANQSAVLVAKQDLARGTVIDSDMLESKIYPNDYVQPQAVTSLDRIAGMTVTAAISKGEQVTLSKLSSKQAQGGSLAMATPVGKRAITIAVDNVASLGGMIKPGDYVDVISMVNVAVETQAGKQATQVTVMPLFQNVLVLAVGQETGSAPQASSRYKKEKETSAAVPLITLALTPHEANLIAFVQEQGKIKLVLRSPADSAIQPVQPATWNDVFQYVYPKTEVKEDAQPTEYVEIYRGMNKEKIPLSK